jgi:Flp pilus assembly protein TadD
MAETTHSDIHATPADAGPVAPSARAVPSPPRSRENLGKWAASLLLLVLFAYLPAYHGGFIWDDDEHLARNPNLRTTEGLVRTWLVPTSSPQYYPITLTTFWVEYHLWGLNPAGYHTTNILLHAADTLLLWLLLRRLAVPGAWLIAAIWGVHPVHVESVAWVTERKNVLSALFYLLATLAYLRPAPKLSSRNATRPRKPADTNDVAAAPEGLSPARPGSARYGLALVLFILALGSKTVTSTWPAAILLVLWWKRGRLTRRDVYPLVPFFAIGAAMGAVTGWLERTHVGATGPDFQHTLAYRCLRAASAVWFYAWKDLCPTGLSFVYPRWAIEPWQWVFVAGTVAAVLALWLMRHRLGRGPLTAVLFFLGTLFPAMGFVNVYPMRFAHVADHFQYLASIGLIALAVAAGHRWLGRRATPLAAVVLCALSGLTLVRANVLADRELVWRDAIAKNPGAWMARANLANTLVHRAEEAAASGASAQAFRDLADAEAQFDAARQLRPDLAEPMVLLARVRELRGRYDDAERLLAEAARVQPDHVGAHFQRGRMLEKLGRPPEAEAEYRRALELKPDSDVVHITYGAMLADQARPAEAEEQFRRALEISPDSVDAQVALGNALLKTGRNAEAAEAFRRALRIDPASPPARNGLAEAEK